MPAYVNIDWKMLMLLQRQRNGRHTCTHISCVIERERERERERIRSLVSRMVRKVMHHATPRHGHDHHHLFENFKITKHSIRFATNRIYLYEDYTLSLLVFSFLMIMCWRTPTHVVGLTFSKKKKQIGKETSENPTKTESRWWQIGMVDVCSVCFFVDGIIEPSTGGGMWIFCRGCYMTRRTRWGWKKKVEETRRGMTSTYFTHGRRFDDDFHTFYVWYACMLVWMTIITISFSKWKKETSKFSDRFCDDS